MSEIRAGIIGYGAIGAMHADILTDGRVSGVKLSAICDVSEKHIAKAREDRGEDVQLFGDVDEFLAAGILDAVIIATPHYFHPPLAIKAFAHDLHVLIEKPAGVFTKDVRQMNAAAQESGKAFAIMFQERTDPAYRKIKQIIDSGELGAMKRSNWIITKWYRPQCYYDSATWRATWFGEGGGVLLNQVPHQLDLWQWICGMPVRVRGFCGFGKYHDIEVEDDVTAYVEYENGATGVFICSTGEAPGTNRLEIMGDNGKIIADDGELTFWKNAAPEPQHRMEADNPFSAPECEKLDLTFDGQGERHVGILKNWIAAISNGEQLISPGVEGINSLEISNAILLSSWIDDWVPLPVDEDKFMAELNERRME